MKVAKDPEHPGVVHLEYEEGEPRTGYVTVTFPTDGAAPTAVLSPGPLARLAYQTPTVRRVDPNPYVWWCMHCGRPGLKEAWGPGGMTCPRCGKTPLSPAELTPAVPKANTAEGALYHTLLSIAEGEETDPRPAADRALATWHTFHPTRLCYRCEWEAGECQCPEGPLINDPHKEKAV